MSGEKCWNGKHSSNITSKFRLHRKFNYSWAGVAFTQRQNILEFELVAKLRGLLIHEIFDIDLKLLFILLQAMTFFVLTIIN
ncbi:CLUMA_CG012413, isoform A [Clunio marinus]|uniref:CLUMA_CG012413, isoform A n=1 Tax=Clunio marinus TaxID=568069 RepID=A0A1J1IEN1_9DIPT|nr:CLUMA_CG012413, isoform A [Clunio marinus]